MPRSRLHFLSPRLPATIYSECPQLFLKINTSWCAINIFSSQLFTSGPLCGNCGWDQNNCWMTPSLHFLHLKTISFIQLITAHLCSISDWSPLLLSSGRSATGSVGALADGNQTSTAPRSEWSSPSSSTDPGGGPAAVDNYNNGRSGATNV